MACLNITNGLFITVAPNWQTGNVTVTTPAGATIRSTISGPSPGLSVAKGGDTEFFTKPPAGTIFFLTFGAPPTFILVLIADSTTRRVVLVNTTGPTIQTRLILTVGAPTTVTLPDVQPCQGSGSVFMLAAGDGNGPLATTSAAIHRSDNGAPLCSAVPFNPSGQVIGEATATQLLIKEGGTIKASAPRPRGRSDITPDPQNFPDAVLGVGVNPALASHIRQFTIRNDGSDCLIVNSISGIAPYSIVGTSQTLPTTLDPGQKMTVDIRFAPTVVGTFNVDLPVSLNPANGDVLLRCRGKGRAAILSVSFPASVGFGSVLIGTSGSKNLTINNTGEATLNIVVPAAPVGSDFQWAAFGGSLAAGGPPAVIPLAFTPTSEGPQTTTLAFTSNAPGSPHSATLSGATLVGNRLGLIIYGADGGGQMRPVFATSNMGQGSGALGWLAGDFTGSGKTQLAQPWNNNGRLGLIIYGADGGGQMRPVFATSNMGQGSGALGWLAGDFTGSGKTQLAQPWNNNGRLGLIIYGADGGGQMRTVFGTENMGQGSGALGWLAGDFTGSGKTQLAQPWNNNGRLGLIIYGADGGGQMRTVFGTENMGQGSGALGWLTGDFTGSGKTQLAQPWNNNGRLGLIIYGADGGGQMRTVFGTENMGQGSGALGWLTGDFTGSGKTQLAQPWNNNGRLGLIIYGADGSGQMRTVFGTENMGQGSGALGWLAGDFTGSGKTQLAQPWNNNGRLGLIIYGADGSGQMRTVFGTENMGQGSGALGWLTGDFTGSGKTQLAQPWNNP